MITDRHEGLIIAALLVFAFLYFGSLVLPKIQTVMEKATKVEVQVVQVNRR